MLVGLRYYDPSVGRFITADPVLGDEFHPQSLNRYVYVENNPVNLVDPSGAQFWEDILDMLVVTVLVVAGVLVASVLTVPFVVAGVLIIVAGIIVYVLIIAGRSLLGY